MNKKSQGIINVKFGFHYSALTALNETLGNIRELSQTTLFRKQLCRPDSNRKHDALAERAIYTCSTLSYIIHIFLNISRRWKDFGA